MFESSSSTLKCNGYKNNSYNSNVVRANKIVLYENWSLISVLEMENILDLLGKLLDIVLYN